MLYSSIFAEIARVIYGEKETDMMEIVQIYGIPRTKYWTSVYLFWVVVFWVLFVIPLSVAFLVYPLFFTDFHKILDPPTKQRADVDMNVITSLWIETPFVMLGVLGTCTF